MHRQAGSRRVSSSPPSITPISTWRRWLRSTPQRVADHRPGQHGRRFSVPDTMLQAAIVDVSLPPGNVAISMQSGTLGSSLLRLAGSLHLGLSWFVSLGDKCDLSANDLLQVLEDDEATAVIALYTESLGNPQAGADRSSRSSARKPIVSGRTGAALVGIGTMRSTSRPGSSKFRPSPHCWTPQGCSPPSR